jgi:hypothetical protein
MIEKLDRKQRRLLALAILLLALALVFSITVLPVLLANQHYRDTIAGLEGRLQQLQRAAAIGDALQPQYEQLKRWKTSEAHHRVKKCRGGEYPDPHHTAGRRFRPRCPESTHTRRTGEHHPGILRHRDR